MTMSSPLPEKKELVVMTRPFLFSGHEEMLIMTISSPLLEKVEVVVMVRPSPLLGKEEMVIMTISSPLLERVELVAMIRPFPRLEKEEMLIMTIGGHGHTIPFFRKGGDDDHDHLKPSSGKGRVGGHDQTIPSFRKGGIRKGGAIPPLLPEERRGVLPPHSIGKRKWWSWS